MCIRDRPLELPLLVLLLRQQGFLFVSKHLQTFLQRLLLGLRQQYDARRLGFELLQRMVSGFVLLIDHRRNLTVDFRACQLLQQLRAIARLRVQEGGKLSLGEQHRAGEAAIVEAGERRGLLQLIRDLIGEDFAVGAARQLDAGRLQVAIRLVTRPRCV